MVWAVQVTLPAVCTRVVTGTIIRRAGRLLSRSCGRDRDHRQVEVATDHDGDVPDRHAARGEGKRFPSIWRRICEAFDQLGAVTARTARVGQNAPS